MLTDRFQNFRRRTRSHDMLMKTPFSEATHLTTLNDEIPRLQPGMLQMHQFSKIANQFMSPISHFGASRSPTILISVHLNTWEHSGYLPHFQHQRVQGSGLKPLTCQPSGWQAPHLKPLSHCSPHGNSYTDPKMNIDKPFYFIFLLSWRQGDLKRLLDLT